MTAFLVTYLTAEHAVECLECFIIAVTAEWAAERPAFLVTYLTAEHAVECLECFIIVVTADHAAE